MGNWKFERFKVSRLDGLVNVSGTLIEFISQSGRDFFVLFWRESRAVECFGLAVAE